MIQADSTGWARFVDAGSQRLLATLGDKRTRWNAPTVTELGVDTVSNSPYGLVAPKGLPAPIAKVLHDAFKLALDDPEYDKLMTRLDMVDWYKSSEDYAEWAVDQFKFQRELVRRTIGLGQGIR